MKKRISKTRRIFTTALSLAIVLGFAFEPVSVYADGDEPEVQATEITSPIDVNSGENKVYEELTKINIVDEAYAIDVRADSYNISDTLENYDASIKVNGDVSLSASNDFYSMVNTIHMYANDANAKAEISGNAYVKGLLFSMGANLEGSGKNYSSYLDIGGNLLTEGDFYADGLVLRDTNAYVKVGKDICVMDSNYATAIYGDNIDGSIKVGGQVIADSKMNEDYGPDSSMGIDLSTDKKAIIDIDDGIISQGSSAYGVSIGISPVTDSSHANVELNVGKGGIYVESSMKEGNGTNSNAGGLSIFNYGGTISSDIKGDFVVKSATGDAVGLLFTHDEDVDGPLSGDIDMVIHGDLISDGHSFYINTVGEPLNTNVVVEGTIDSKKGIFFKISDYQDPDIGITFSENLDQTLNLTAWKIELKENGYFTEYQPIFDEPSPAKAFEKNVNYIIKTEQTSEGGTFAVSDADGNALATVKDLEVAHEGDIIYVEPSVEDGYVLKGVYSGIDDDKIELAQDKEGKYYIVVPKGGGVYLTMDVEKKVEPTPTPEVTPTPEATPTPAVTSTPAENVTPTAAPSSQPTSGIETTPTPGTDVTPAPGGDVTPAPGTDATPTPSITPDDGSTAKKDNKTTFKIGKKTLKNKSKIKKSAKIKIKDKDKIKSITLNGKKIKIKKNKTSFTLKLKSHKKKLKAKGKWNKLVVTDKNGKKKTLKFKIKK